MTNIIRAVFNCNEYNTTATRPDGKPIYQYNYGQILQIHGLDLPKAVEIHFSHSMGGSDAIIRIGTTTDKVTEVAVPEKFLEAYGTVTAYIYVSNTESGQTEYKIQFQIAQRAKPEAWDSPEDAELFHTAIEAVNESAGKAEDAAARAEESAGNAGQSAQDAEVSATAAKTSETTAKNLADGFLKTVDDAKVDITTHTAQEKEQAISAIKAQGGEVQENISESVNTANTVNSELDASIANAETAVENVKTATENAQTAESGLGVTIGGANTAKTELDGAISRSENVKSGLDTSITAGTQLNTDINASIDTANTAKTELDGAITEIDVAKTEAIQSVEQEGAAQIQSLVDAGGGIENALSNYFALRRSNKVFTTKLYKYTTSTSPLGEKMNDNAGMVCQPSVGHAAGQDDYQQYGLFKHFTCNWHVDENGYNHVDVLEGQAGFSKTGKVQVGEVTMGGWFGLEDVGDAVLYHYSAVKSERTPRPMKESINPDGTINPIMIHAKYKAIDLDGAPYSSAGGAPANGCQATEAKDPVSYTGMVGYMHKLGAHYCGTTCWDLFYLQLMFIVKYATTHSQSVMAGCTSYNYQYNAEVAETGVMRVVMAKADAAKYVVGSYVSVGEMGDSTSKDRYGAYMHNLAYSVKVTRVEDVDATNAAVYVDAPEAFDTTLTTYLTTMPWHTGSTDEVAGSDGSPGNNASGIYPCKLQGIEWHTGAYEVLGNVFMDIVTGTDGNPARDVWVCEDASKLTTNVTTAKSTYKKAKAQVPYTAGAWKYITEETTDIDRGIMIPTGVGAGSATGWADGLYTDAGTYDQREWLALGNLSGGARAGLWVLDANSGWLGAYWSIASSVSPNGTRGEYQAVA